MPQDMWQVESQNIHILVTNITTANKAPEEDRRWIQVRI